MAGGLDKVDTRVNAVVNNVHPIDLVFSIEVGIEALVDVVDNGAPRLVVVDKVTESRSVDHRQPQTHTILLNVSANGLDRHCLGDDVGAGASSLFWWI